MPRPHHFSSPRAFAAAVRYEALLRTRRARSERALGRGGPVLTGPWLSEIGFELLYWIPLLRALLDRHGVAPERVTALSRGGARDWYAGIADHYVDVLELVGVEEYRRAQRARVAGPDTQKQLTVTAFDHELWRRAGAADAIHPLSMYSRLRYYWGAGEGTDYLARHCRWERFPAPPDPGVALPDDFVAAKPYFSDCFPPTEANRALVAEAVLALAERTDVVLLTTGLELDEHLEAELAAHPRVHDLAPHMRPADNLALQTRVAARARALVSTYGGPAYLGMFLGVPVVSVLSEHNHNPKHLAAARLAAEHVGAPAPLLVEARRPGAAREVAELAHSASTASNSATGGSSASATSGSHARSSSSP